MTDVVTVNVLFTVKRPGGTLVPGAVVRAKLTALETDDGFVVPAVVEGVAGEDATAILPMWPNARGANGSRYAFAMYDTAQMVIASGHIVVPEVDVSLQPVRADLLLDRAPYPTQNAAQLAVRQLQQAQVQIDASVQEATDQAAIAIGVVSDAGFQSIVARTSEIDALALHVADLANLGPHAADLPALASRTSELDALSDRTVQIDALGARSIEIDALGARTAQIDALDARTIEIDGLAARTVQIDALGARTTEIDALGARTTELDALGARTTEIDTLVAHTVQIDAVAGDMATIIAVAGDLLAINDAPAQAEIAATKAVQASDSAAAALAIYANTAAMNAALAQAQSLFNRIYLGAH